MRKLLQARTERILLAVVIVMGAAILAGTAVLIAVLVDLAGQGGAGAPTVPADDPHA